jgi:nitroreductase
MGDGLRASRRTSEMDISSKPIHFDDRRAESTGWDNGSAHTINRDHLGQRLRQTRADEAAEAVAMVMATQRAVRRLLPTPIPRDLIEKIVFLSTRAPSASNRQPWEFVAITDGHVRAQLGDIYGRASRALFERLIASAIDARTRRLYRDALYLADHMGDAPLILVVCAQVSDQRPLSEQLSSIYPAIQNVLLAARAHGLGSVLTTAHKRNKGEIQALLKLPNEIEPVCLIPVGYPVDPVRAFRPIDARRSVTEVLHWDWYTEKSPK